MGGQHDYVIETGGVTVFPRIVPREQHRDFVRAVNESIFVASSFNFHFSKSINADEKPPHIG